MTSLRVVAAGAGEHRHLPARFVDEDLDDPRRRSAIGQRRALAGRAARHEEVNAGVDLPAPEATNGRLVEVAVPGERRDERGADAGPWSLRDPCTSCD